VEVAGKFASKISLINEAENEYINAKSVLGISSLGAVYNTTLLVWAEGPDEAEALQAIIDLFERPFDVD
jgi:phosphocarrier protein